MQQKPSFYAFNIDSNLENHEIRLSNSFFVNNWKSK